MRAHIVMTNPLISLCDIAFGSFGILFLPNWLALFGGSLWMEDVHVVVQSCEQHSNAECNETKKIDKSLQ